MTDTSTDAGQQLVPNPEYRDLLELRDQIKQAMPGIRSALDQPAADLGGGTVWTGPVAEAFSQEVTGRKQRLATLVATLLAGVEARLRTTPADCTRDEVTSYRRYRRTDRY